MHPELLPHLILDQPNQALRGNDQEIVDGQTDCSNDCSLNFKHEQSSIDK